MLNRKATKISNGANGASNGAGNPGRTRKRVSSGEARKPRKRFIISAKAAGRLVSPPPRPTDQIRNEEAQTHSASRAKAAYASNHEAAAPGARSQVVDLTQTIKTLVQLAREQGHVTYDDINDILPDGLSPDDLDELYTKLRDLDIEVVEHAEIEKPKPAEAEEEVDHRLDVLDDPVRMYMNQMGKVPLLTREQEVEVCKSIEEAELEMKRLIYSLGFTAKEHSAIAEKLLADPPKERFDRIVVDKKVSSREGHLKVLRSLLKKVRESDLLVDEHYVRWQKAASPGRRKKLFAEFQKLDTRLQAAFPKFFYKQKVLEDMIVVARNVQEKFQAGLKRIQELEAQPKPSRQEAALQEERDKIVALEQFIRQPREEFARTFDRLERAADRAHQAKTHMAEAN